MITAVPVLDCGGYWSQEWPEVNLAAMNVTCPTPKRDVHMGVFWNKLAYYAPETSGKMF